MKKETDLKKDKRVFTMAEEKPVKAVLKMGIPMTLGMLFMVFYNLVDTYFIGKLNNDYQLAASNLGYPVMMILVALSAIVASGGASYIARCIGAGEMDNANHALVIGFELIAYSSIIISIMGMLLINPIVNLLGADENTYLYTKQYIAALFIGAIFVMGNYTFGQLLRSEGSVMPSMVGLILGTVVNIILDPIFIFVFKMEILGAAIATVLGNMAGAIYFLSFYIRKKTILTPSIKYLKFDMKIVGEIMKVGLPHTLEQFFTTAAMVVLNNLAAAYGGMVVAGMGIANKILSFGSYIYQGITAGCQPIFGFCYGAKNYKRLRSIIYSSILVSTAIELVVMGFFQFTAPILVGAFSQTEEVILIGAKSLRALMLMLPFVSVTSVCRNTYNSMGKPVQSFVITLVRQVGLYIPLLILFNKIWEYDGIIHAQPATELICMFMSGIMMLFELKKLEKN